MERERLQPTDCCGRGKGAFLLVIVCILLLAGTAQAIGTWSEGTVTGGPWFGKQNRIEISGINYMVMPEIKVWLPKNVVSDASGEKQRELLGSFERGTKVRIKAHGHSLYEIMIYK